MTVTAEAPDARSHLALARWAPEVREPFDLFALLLAFGVINHKHFLSGLATDFSNIGVPIFLAGAVGLLFRPSSRALLLLVAAGIAIDVAYEMPAVVNHWFVFGPLACAFVVIGAIALSVRPQHRRDVVAAGAFLLTAVLLVGLFLLATLHKLNDGFLDTVHSCAVSHANDLTRLFRLGEPLGNGSPLALPLIAAVLATELAIPLLLLRRRTRWAGLALGFAFHYVNAINGHQPFSGLALALYVPFLPRAVFRQLRGQDVWQRVAWRAVQGAGVGVVALGGALALLGRDVDLHWQKRIVFLVVAPLIAVAVIRAWRAEPGAGRSGSSVRHLLDAVPRSARRVLVVVAVLFGLLVTVNGLSAYAGVKSQLTFSMYSNLRVEGEEHWNHLFVPEAVRVFDDTAAVIEVLDVGPEPIRWLEGQRLNTFEVRRVVHAHCDEGPVSLRYRADARAVPVELSDACDSQFGRPPGLLARKFLTYRPVLEPNSCQW